MSRRPKILLNHARLVYNPTSFHVHTYIHDTHFSSLYIYDGHTLYNMQYLLVHTTPTGTTLNQTISTLIIHLKSVHTHILWLLQHTPMHTTHISYIYDTHITSKILINAMHVPAPFQEIYLRSSLYHLRLF